MRDRSNRAPVAPALARTQFVHRNGGRRPSPSLTHPLSVDNAEELVSTRTTQPAPSPERKHSSSSRKCPRTGGRPAATRQAVDQLRQVLDALERPSLDHNDVATWSTCYAIGVPSVGVTIPTHGRPDGLHACLEHLDVPRGWEVQITVVENGTSVARRSLSGMEPPTFISTKGTSHRPETAESSRPDKSMPSRS